MSATGNAMSLYTQETLKSKSVDGTWNCIIISSFTAMFAIWAGKIHVDRDMLTFKGYRQHIVHIILWGVLLVNVYVGILGRHGYCQGTYLFFYVYR